MADDRLRAAQHAAITSGAVDDEARALLERLRAGSREKLSDQHFPVFALIVANRQEALDVLQRSDVPRRAIGMRFLQGIGKQYQSLQMLFEYYTFSDEKDVALPSEEQVFEALLAHFKSHSEHFEVVHHMKKPVLQFVPLFAHEGAGFSRLSRFRNHSNECRYQSTLRKRWQVRRFLDADGKIMDCAKVFQWKLAVVEGKGFVGSNLRYSWDERQRLYRHSSEEWDRKFSVEGVHLPTKEVFLLLQMDAIRRSRGASGIDAETVYSVLTDSVGGIGIPTMDGCPLSAYVHFDSSGRAGVLRPTFFVELPASPSGGAVLVTNDPS